MFYWAPSFRISVNHDLYIRDFSFLKPVKFIDWKRFHSSIRFSHKYKRRYFNYINNNNDEKCNIQQHNANTKALKSQKLLNLNIPLNIRIEREFSRLIPIWRESCIKKRHSEGNFNLFAAPTPGIRFIFNTHTPTNVV